MFLALLTLSEQLLSRNLCVIVLRTYLVEKN
jgi:hypothetical protein